MKIHYHFMPLVTASLVTVEIKGPRGHSDAICVEGESHTHTRSDTCSLSWGQKSKMNTEKQEEKETRNRIGREKEKRRRKCKKREKKGAYEGQTGATAILYWPHSSLRTLYKKTVCVCVCVCVCVFVCVWCAVDTCWWFYAEAVSCNHIITEPPCTLFPQDRPQTDCTQKERTVNVTINYKPQSSQQGWTMGGSHEGTLSSVKQWLDGASRGLRTPSWIRLTHTHSLDRYGSDLSLFYLWSSLYRIWFPQI